MSTNRASQYLENFLNAINEKDLSLARSILRDLNLEESKVLVNSYIDDMPILNHVIRDFNEDVIDWINLLIEHGVDPSLRDRKGFRNTGLLEAIAKGNWEIVRKLIQSFDPQKYKDYINKKSNLPGATNTPLTFLLKLENVPFDVYQLLLSKGANVNLTDHTGSSALHYVVCLADMELLDLLLDPKNNPDLDIRNKQGFTPYDAYLSNFKPFVSLLKKSNYCLIKEWIEMPMCLYEKGLRPWSMREKLAGEFISVHFEITDINLFGNLNKIIERRNKSNLIIEIIKSSGSNGLDTIMANFSLKGESDKKILMRLRTKNTNENNIQNIVDNIKEAHNKQQENIKNLKLVLKAKNNELVNLFLQYIYENIYKEYEAIPKELFALCCQLVTSESLNDLKNKFTDFLEKNPKLLSEEHITELKYHVRFLELLELMQDKLVDNKLLEPYLKNIISKLDEDLISTPQQLFESLVMSLDNLKNALNIEITSPTLFESSENFPALASKEIAAVLHEAQITEVEIEHIKSRTPHASAM